MAFASVGSIGTVSSGNANQATIVMTTAATVEAGNLAVVIAAFDNHNTTDADHSEVTGVVDSAGGNTWSKFAEFTNGQGEAQAGTTVSIWGCRLATQLDSGQTITMSLTEANSRDATAMTGWEFTVGGAVTQTASTGLAGDAADPAAITLSGLASKEYLWLWGIALESVVATTITQDSDYTAITAAGQGIGSGATTVGGGFRIATLTGDTVDASTSVDRDHAQVLVALEEAVAGGDIEAGLVGGKLTSSILIKGGLI